MYITVFLSNGMPSKNWSATLKTIQALSKTGYTNASHTTHNKHTSSLTYIAKTFKTSMFLTNVVNCTRLRGKFVAEVRCLMLRL